MLWHEDDIPMWNCLLLQPLDKMWFLNLSVEVRAYIFSSLGPKAKSHHFFVSPSLQLVVVGNKKSACVFFSAGSRTSVVTCSTIVIRGEFDSGLETWSLLPSREQGQGLIQGLLTIGFQLLGSQGSWWFQFFLIFTHILGRFPLWLIFFKGVEPPTSEVFVARLEEIPCS